MDTIQINEEILEIWKKSPIPSQIAKKMKEKNVLAPLFYPKIREKSLLFIGFNPSFVLSALAKDHNISEEIIPDFYDINNIQNRDEWIEQVVIATKNYSYFNKFQCVTDYLNKEIPNSDYYWEHIDLLLFRRTKQSELLESIGMTKTDNPRNITNIDTKKFILDQLAISKKLIKQLDPRIIVVANAKASRIYKNYFDLEWSDTTGCYLTTIGNKNIQTHLTGMLTGQRALDNESFKMLNWNIKNSYITLNKK